jgi:hypothetical protein
MNQRWREQRASYRPPQEVICTRHYEVSLIEGDTEPKAFVMAHHYLGSYPAARFRFGLYHKGELCGIAVFSRPTNDLSLTNVFHCDPTLSADLGRFVLLDEVPGNGETFFLGQCFSLLRREGLAGITSFSDPLPRRTDTGEIVHRGHIGTIYQAFNGLYLGRSAPRKIRLLPDGSVFHDRNLHKIRQQQQGWKYASELLQRFGATPLNGNPGAWLDKWLPIVTRSVHHPGNHKYAWALDKRLRKQMPKSLPYPKFDPLFLHLAHVG